MYKKVFVEIMQRVFENIEPLKVIETKLNNKTGL